MHKRQTPKETIGYCKRTYSLIYGARPIPKRCQQVIREESNTQFAHQDRR